MSRPKLAAWCVAFAFAVATGSAQAEVSAARPPEGARPLLQEGVRDGREADKPGGGSVLRVDDAWVRGTVAGQKTTGAYMRITSAADATLIGVASPAAGRVEIHEMKMDGGVMRMSAVTALPLPAGKPVALGPGGYHVMLLDLAHPLKEGDSVPLTLTIADKAGKTQKIDVRAQVRPLGAPAPRGN